jgi:AcrR family transcriptional regulator
LLAAAAELIAELGWRGVSTRLVAERAGVGAGLVHYHFASLQALLTEAALGVMRGVLDDLGPLLDTARTPYEAVDLLFGSLAGHTGRDPASLLFIEAYLASTRDDDLREAVAALIAEFRERLAARLAGHGLDDPDETVAVLAAAVDGVLLHRAMDPSLTGEIAASVLRRLLMPASEPGGGARR